jgi:hypothetical protein
LLKIGIGVFFVLHGLVHLLYAGQSWRLLQLESSLLWPDGSWAFAGLLGEGATRGLASVACALCALGFVAAGVGVLLGQAWWRPTVAGAAALSIVVFALFWDGDLQNLDGKGGIAILIDAAILVALVLSVRVLDLEL